MTKDNSHFENNSSLLIYQTVDGLTKIQTRLENETVWLNQEQMSVLFQRDRSVITKHIGNIFKEGELEEKSNVQNLHIGRHTSRNGLEKGIPNAKIISKIRNKFSNR